MKTVIGTLGMAMALTIAGCGVTVVAPDSSTSADASQGADSTPIENGPGAFVASCNAPQAFPEPFCNDYHRGYTPDTVMSGCALLVMTTYAASPCRTADRVGRCTVTTTTGLSTEPTRTFVASFYAPMTVDTARAECMRRAASDATAVFEAN